MYRIISAIGIWIVGIFCTPFILAPLAIVYAFMFRSAYELIVLAACIDAFFGSDAFLPYYTLSAIAIVGIAELIKPHLALYAHLRT